MALGIIYNELKTNTDTLLTQKGAIVQITHCFILNIYIYKSVFKCNISKARDRKMTFP